MTGLAIPAILTIIGVIVATIAYRNVRRGAARYYTLEREALLRQAGFTLLASVFFFLAAVAMLVYNVQQLRIEEIINAGVEVEGIPTVTPTLAIFPPTPTPFLLATAEPVATPEPTAIVRRAVVDGTGTGLYLRTEPGGAEVEILPDGTTLSVLPDAPQQINGVTWVKVRTTPGDEGWVAENFLIIRDQ
jgi:hypothetical protein